MPLARINALRDTRASLVAKQQQAAAGKAEAEAALTEMGWDGEQSVPDFVAALRAEADAADSAATIAVEEAEKLTKEFQV